jgi:hypothetical protein
MVELVVWDSQLETENVEDVVLVQNYDQAMGFGLASGLVDLDIGSRSLDLYTLSDDGWQYAGYITEDMLEN